MQNQANQIERTSQNPRSLTSGGKSPLNSKPAPLQPSGATEAVALITSCLALVKPVGMSGDDAHAWLIVAAGEVSHLPRDILEAACAAARRTCTHHGQIVPAILKDSTDWLNSRRVWARPVKIAPGRCLPAPDPWQPTREELDALKAATCANMSASR